jgi:hypothetical protein
MKPFGPAMLGLGLLVAVSAQAQRGTSLPNDLPAVDAAAMLRTAAPDLQKRIARFKPVRMPFDSAGLSANERQMIDQLVIASSALESIYGGRAIRPVWRSTRRSRPSPRRSHATSGITSSIQSCRSTRR